MKDLHASLGLDALEGNARAPFLTRSPTDLTLPGKKTVGVLRMSRLNDPVDVAEAHVRALILGLLEHIHRSQAK